VLGNCGRYDGLMQLSPTERFSSRAENYARYRPGYPAPAIALLQQRCGLGPGTVVADVGSGTGLLTVSLLDAGAQVFAVEPNGPMRSAAEEWLGTRPGFQSVDGSAEATTLADRSIDLLVAAQAFHWFDVAAARREMLRILRPGRWAALVWNERPPRVGRFFHDYEDLMRRFAVDYDRIAASRADIVRMREFLGDDMDVATFPNSQSMDFDGLRGRLLSSSYAPDATHPNHAPLMHALREVFERHQRQGRIEFPYETLVYFSRPA
jgi:SAM-dependent methyltransferase